MTYTLEDMKRTRKLVLGIIMIMYFPTILNIIYKMTENYIDKVISKASLNNDFNKLEDIKRKDKSELTRIDLIEIFVEKFEKKSNLLLSAEDNTDTEQYSAKEYDYIRKSTMDEVSKPENGLYAYEAMKEIIQELNRGDLIDDINIGIDLYEAKSSGQSLASFFEKYGMETVKQV